MKNISAILITIILISASNSFAASDYEVDGVFPLYMGTVNLQGGYRMPIGFYDDIITGAPAYGLIMHYNPKWWSGWLLNFNLLFSTHPFQGDNESSISFLTMTMGPTYILPLWRDLHLNLSMGIGGQFSMLKAINTDNSAQSYDPYGEGSVKLVYNMPWEAEIFIGLSAGSALESSSLELLGNATVFGGLTYHFDPKKLAAKKESLLRIVKIKPNELFSARYRIYKDEALGTASLVNRSKKILTDVRVTIHFPDYSNKPFEVFSAKKYVAEEKADFDLKTIFNSNILSFKDSKEITAVLKASYKSGDKKFSYQEKVDFKTNGRNALSWSILNSTGSFITHTDKTVTKFARKAIVGFNANRPVTIPKKIAQAMWIFDSMGKLGISYVSDPQSPFESALKNSKAIDTVFYPREMLEQKAGDCDDLSVLYTALLENIGIETALVTVPGHIFILFNSKIPFAARKNIYVNPDMLYKIGGRVWIPVEVTLVGKSFFKAWKAGAKELRRWDGTGKMDITYVRSAWRDYPPVEFDKSDDSLSFKEKLFSKNTNGIIKNDLTFWYKTGFTDKIAEFNKTLKSDESNLKVRTMLGLTYARFRKFEKAIEIFKDILKRKSSYYYVQLNIGSIYYMQKKYKKAIEYYANYLKYNPNSAKGQISIAKAYHADKNYIKSKKHYELAVKQKSSMKSQFAYLDGKIVDGTEKAADVENDTLPLWDEGGEGSGSVHSGDLVDDLVE